MTGGLVISHRLKLPTRDYPGCPGPVSCMKWTPDGTALAIAWGRGGFSLWSTFGAMIMCSLCWDYGISVSDPVEQNPLCVKSMDWSAEGYQMWIINSSKKSKKNLSVKNKSNSNKFVKAKPGRRNKNKRKKSKITLSSIK